MIPKKIEIKVKQKYKENKVAFNTIMELLKNEEKGSKQNQHCKEIIEKYVDEVKDDEN